MAPSNVALLSADAGESGAEYITRVAAELSAERQECSADCRDLHPAARPCIACGR